MLGESVAAYLERKLSCALHYASGDLFAYRLPLLRASFFPQLAVTIAAHLQPAVDAG